MRTTQWNNPTLITPRGFTCGYCGHHTGPDKGYFSTNTKPLAAIYLCTYCGGPTYFDGSDPDPAKQKQYPGAPFGKDVAALPKDVADLYAESRSCMMVNSLTAAVLICRKLLVHIAAEEKADTGKTFLEYVEYLAQKGYVPPDGKGWVDHIRKKGNEANHEIKIMSRPDAEDLLIFAEMLLKFVYEFPAKVQALPAPAQS